MRDSKCGSLLVLLPLCLHARLIQECQLKETASAPALITARILAIHRDERVPEDQLSWKEETWVMTADVEVLRSFTAAGTPRPFHTIQVRFRSLAQGVTQFTDGFPPRLPNLMRGEVRVLPLRENDNPESRPWQLITENSCFNAIIPARAEAADDRTPASSGRAFLIREFANTLSRGTPGEIAALGEYLLWQTDYLSGDLMPLAEPAVGNDRQQWAEIAAGLHAALGIPRPTVADLFSTKPAVPGSAGPYRGVLPLLQAVLRKLQASPATDELLIRTWIADAPFYAWGSANSLIEYADNPLTTEILRQALRNDLRGSSYIALVLANRGNKAILPDAVARAFRVLDDPAGLGSDLTEVQGAAALLRDRGSDQDLARLATIVRKYQALDPKYYSVLWGDATGSDNLHETRVLTVVLADRRIAFRSLRYCDLALGEFDRLTKQQFDIERASVQERDAAISRALAWIRVH